jgi:hypothetical protein
METKSFEELKNELINTENSFVDKYNNAKNKKMGGYSYEDIKKETDICILEKQMQIFSSLFEGFQKNYIEIFSITKEKLKIQSSTQQEKDKYLKVGELYLNVIQNLYLNPINYRINKLKSDESLSKANESICWAKISIWIAIVSFIISIILSIVSIKKTIYYGKNPISCSCCSIETEQTQVISEKGNSNVDMKALPLIDDTIK